MICDLFFPTSVWHDKLEINNFEIKNFCKEKSKLLAGREISNINGWQSEDLDHIDFRLINLNDSIIERSKIILEQFKYDTKNLNLKIYNMWINLNYPGSSNKVHIHHNSILSGVFYVKCKKDSGDLIFHRNFSDQFSILNISKIVENNYLNHCEIHYTPEENKLIIFPSWIPHSVDKNRSKEDRISISFNIGFA